ncbi:MAG: hypothetical protein GY913_02740 [Proteobacteria bacterium]|nr:hypothetical protein [Pseudomonadota bacterium]
MIVLLIACIGDMDPSDSGADSGLVDSGEASTVCPPWAGLELGTDQLYEDTDEYQASSNSYSTYTHTVVSHADWDEGGTLVTTQSATTYEASHLDDYAGEYTRTYGCNDEGAWMLTTEFAATWTSGGEPVESTYSTEWDGYLSMSWTPQDGWTVDYTYTRTDPNGSFSDGGSFSAEVTAEDVSVEIGAGTFTGIAIDYDGDRTHWYDEDHGTLRSPSSWLAE